MNLHSNKSSNQANQANYIQPYSIFSFLSLVNQSIQAVRSIYTLHSTYIELLARVQLCKRRRYSLSTAVCYLLLLSLLPLYSYIYCTVCCIIPFQYFLQQCSILHPFHLISTVVIYYSLLSSLCIEFPTACIVSESPLPS